jgi:hypothetical protein
MKGDPWSEWGEHLAPNSGLFFLLVTALTCHCHLPARAGSCVIPLTLPLPWSVTTFADHRVMSLRWVLKTHEQAAASDHADDLMTGDDEADADALSQLMNDPLRAPVEAGFGQCTRSSSVLCLAGEPRTCPALKIPHLSSCWRTRCSRRYNSTHPKNPRSSRAMGTHTCSRGCGHGRSACD